MIGNPAEGPIMSPTQLSPTPSNAPARAPRGRPDYGIDAPNVVRVFLLLGVIGLAALVTRIAGLWNEHTWAGALGWPVICFGLSMGLTGAVMGWDSKVGKIRRRDRVLAGLPWLGDETVLDVGCGRGLYLIGAAGRVPNGRAVGIDIWSTSDLSGNAMDATRRNAEVEGVADRVELKTADAREMPFADGTFDCVLSSMALHNIYDAAGRDKAIREIARVLKPGGRAAILDMRHTAQYADAFRAAGCSQVERRSPPTGPLIAVLTWGAVRLGTVVVLK
jgi:SAM-dependent methyltransferase